MKEIIFFDVDDTLLDSRSHKVADSTITALRYLAKHYDMAIATGRSLSSLIDSEITSLIAWNGFVCNNGQMIYDQNQQLLVQHTIDDEAVQEVLAIAKQRKEPVLLATPLWQRIGECSSYMEEAHSFFHIDIPENSTQLHGDVIMMLVYGPKGWDYAPYQSIPGLDLMPGQSTYCDLVKAGFDKSIGIQTFIKHFQYSSYIAFGDSNNDLGMLKQARLAIVLGQGTKEAKALADFVSKPVYEDGIAYAVEHLKL